MSPRRIQLRRTKGWRLPKDAVNVARPTKWGNPYRASDYPKITHPIAAEEPVRVSEADRRRYAVTDFEAMVKHYIGGNSYPSFEEIRSELAGKNLACWCPLDGPCHADVLLELANGPTAPIADLARRLEARTIETPEDRDAGLMTEAARMLRKHAQLHQFLFRDGNGLLEELHRADEWPGYELGERLSARMVALDDYAETW